MLDFSRFFQCYGVKVLIFDPSDPFPSIPPTAASYAEEQLHSAQADRFLGFSYEKIEDLLKKRETSHQIWKGLQAQALMTPYTEIRRILEKLSLREGDHIIDLGAAYGRMAFVLAAHFPGVRFLGYEWVKERVDEGNRVFAKRGLDNQVFHLQETDLSSLSFSPEAAPFYFLYDYGTKEAISKTLSDLKKIARNQKITVVGRGRSSRDAIEQSEPWLSQVIQPIHFGHFSIYRSA